MSYNTKQKDIILNIIKEKKKAFTVKEIYEDLNKSIGLTTIYRLIDKLVNEKKVNKTLGNDNITYYQYLEECSNHNHFYLKCNNCGNMIHIDCDCISDLTKHISNKHEFSLTKDHIIIDGICKNCLKKGNK